MNNDEPPKPAGSGCRRRRSRSRGQLQRNTLLKLAEELMGRDAGCSMITHTIRSQRKSVSDQ